MIRLIDNVLSYALPAPEAATFVVVSDGAGHTINTYQVDGDSVTIPQSDIPLYDIYTLTWDTGIVERVERVQRRYFSDGELRDFMGSTLSSDVKIDILINTVEGVFDQSASRSFCLKGAREKFYSTPYRNRMFTLSETDIYEVYSVTVEGEPVDFKVYDGRVLAYAPEGSEVDVHYSYGLVNEPLQLKRCALLFASSIAGDNASNLSPRATGEQNEYGYIRYSVAGRDGATGIPEVDAFLGFDVSKGGYGYMPMVIV